MVAENTLRMSDEKQVSFEAKFNPNKCLKQIKLPISPYTCAPISTLIIILPCNIETLYGVDQKISLILVNSNSLTTKKLGITLNMALDRYMLALYRGSQNIFLNLFFS